MTCTSSFYINLNAMITVNDALKILWNWAVWDYFKVPYRDLSAETEETLEYTRFAQTIGPQVSLRGCIFTRIVYRLSLRVCMQAYLHYMRTMYARVRVCTHSRAQDVISLPVHATQTVHMTTDI
jgi:hypothetical protein